MEIATPSPLFVLIPSLLLEAEINQLVNFLFLINTPLFQVVKKFTNLLNVSS
jgi:hypothetical protein